MGASRAQTLAAFRWLRPRYTVRVRLTLLYSGLLVVSSAVLIAVTYGLVSRATADATYTLSNGASVSVNGDFDESSDSPPPDGGGETVSELTDGATPPVEQPSPQEAAALIKRQHDAQMHQFLTQSLVAFGITAAVSVVAGWFLAGRALRKVSTITAKARDISASNLHERLALDGPDDELKELADTFDALLSRLDAAFAAQQRFVANASHELRTPLARQRTLIQVALADPDASAGDLRATCHRVLAAEDEQNRLIDALLALARGQAGAERHEEFDLAVLADEVLTRCEAEARARGLAVRSTLATAPARGDRRLAERLVTNLVDNAMRHNVDRNGDRDEPGRIDVATATRDGLAVVTVTNTGQPVPADEIEELFVPFRRLGAERTTNSTGVGLGLSIVKAIADAHGATINPAANPGGGLTVEVTFPAQQKPAAA